MKTLLLAIVTFLVLQQCHGGEITYEQGYADWQAGRPMVVVVHASWCPACQAMVGPRCVKCLRDSDVRYVAINVDKPYVDGFCNGEPIPRVIVYRRGLPMVCRIGYMTVIQVRELTK